MPNHREGEIRPSLNRIAIIFSTLKEKGIEADIADCVVTNKDMDQLVTPEQLRRYDVIGIGGLISSYKRVKHEIVTSIRTHGPQGFVICRVDRTDSLVEKEELT